MLLNVGKGHFIIYNVALRANTFEKLFYFCHVCAILLRFIYIVACQAHPALAILY